MTKYIFVVGGVMSSVGKGVASASIATVLQARGHRVTNVKCDMYVNIDAGTIRPTEHGEVFVGEDGIEADQDLGNYERFTGRVVSAANYITTGQVYQEVIRRERNLEYGGEDVEVVPDVPNEIIRRIKAAAKKDDAEITVVEFGGTVGEYQVLLFLEAARIMKVYNPRDVAVVLVSYLPIPTHVGEMKTKPTQYAVRTLNAAGLQADFIIARGVKTLDRRRRDVLAKVCNLIEGTVIAAPDVSSIYDVPLQYHEQGFDTGLLKIVGLSPRTSDMAPWRRLNRRIGKLSSGARIAIVGKYFTTGDFTLVDSYISVVEAVKHACWANNVLPEFTWVDSEEFENNRRTLKQLSQFDGILVPGGFGERGVEGIMAAIEYVRKKEIAYFGLCYGLQLAVVEFARNVCKLRGAHTTEVNPDAKHPVIHVMPGQVEYLKRQKYGATMRLGAYPCVIQKGSKALRAYGTNVISERHRHRYEVNNDYRVLLEKHGMMLSGLSPDGQLVEMIELPNHPFFLATQFHPEFKSSPLRSHPLFRAFVKAAIHSERTR